METVDLIEQLMKEKLGANHVRIIDESHLHKGHKVAGGGGHYNLTVVSKQFENQSPLNTRRMVYQALDEQINGSPKLIHALQIKTLTPEQWGKMAKSN